MKHSHVIDALCDALTEGQGINEALAELNLNPTYLRDHLENKDRARLHQSRMIFIEGLERVAAQRAAAGRNTFELRRTLWYLRTDGRLVLPGDDDVPNIEPIEPTEPTIISPIPDQHDDLLHELGDIFDLAGRIGAFVSEDAETDEPPAGQDRPRTRPRLPTVAAIPTCKPCSGGEKGSNAPEPPPPEPEPPAAPQTRWRRLFSDRLQETEVATGKVVRTVEPSDHDYRDIRHQMEHAQ